MTDLRFHCCDERRLSAVSAHPTLNAIDFLEVVDGDAPAGSPRQQTLLVRLLKPAPAGADELAADNIGVEGGERIVDPDVEWVSTAANPPLALTNAAERAFFTSLEDAASVLVVRTRNSGDFSTYRLRIRRSAQDLSPPLGFDPRLSNIEFCFRVECPSDFDCAPVHHCAAPDEAPPDIDYLVKDYPGFRRLMLDRMAALMPGWQGRSPADLGVTLVEALAYTADQLSYWQDGVATEAYLETARRRTSLRRHATLVDYAVDDGRNARVWVHVTVNADDVLLPGTGIALFTTAGGIPARVSPGSAEERQLRLTRPAVFETASTARLFLAHNEMQFYAWGDRDCALPAGATAATLRGQLLHLQAGKVVVFEEVVGPRTGQPEDADPNHRQAVMLVSASVGTDPLTGADITNIAWHQDDALTFALCLTATTDAAHGGDYLEHVSVVRGNIVLADAGDTIENEDLGNVVSSGLRYPAASDADCCEPAPEVPVPPRFRPRLQQGPLTHAPDPSVQSYRSAHAALAAQSVVVRPQIWLRGLEGADSEVWYARSTLLNSDAAERHFVVEMEHDGSALLRFGDDHHGRRPEIETHFLASYRIGNGASGNVGANALTHVLSSDGRIDSVRNPLSATGGRDPESAAQIRRRAPQAFRRQARAVTPEDYVSVTERASGVQRAAATPRWTGSWHTMFITVDGAAGVRLDEPREGQLRAHVEPFRMAGHDVEFDDPMFVSLELEINVCVEPGYFRAHVRQALLEILSSGKRPDGTLGLFHPDNFSFGQTVYLSPIVAAARDVPGVDSVNVARFARQGSSDPRSLADGLMRLGRLEVPRLANDPNFPEHGVLRLHMAGGI